MEKFKPMVNHRKVKKATTENLTNKTFFKMPIQKYEKNYKKTNSN